MYSFSDISFKAKKLSLFGVSLLWGQVFSYQILCYLHFWKQKMLSRNVLSLIYFLWISKCLEMYMNSEVDK